MKRIGLKKTIKKSVLVIGLFVSGAVLAQDTVRGYVFEDTNRNGKMDRREKGIPEVGVTNGVEVVLTDAYGKYQLPVGTDNIIAVIKPSYYYVEKNEENLPQFFYIHKPEGSPESKFKGVAPTGKLPESVDFALFPSEEKDEFRALVFGDPQPNNREHVEFFARGIVSELEGIENVAFGISLGDLVGNDLDLFNPYIKAVQKVGIPWYNLLGNHDMNFDAEKDELADETFEAHFGPANYAFNQGKVHFIVLDDVIYPDPRDEKGYWGGLREDQLQFIENDLKYVPKDYLIVLTMHIPLSEGPGDGFIDEDRSSLFRLLKDFPHTLSLSGHTHIQKQDFLKKEDGWLQEGPHHHYNVGTTSGNWYSGKYDENGVPISVMRDGTPKGYAFLSFDGNQYAIDYKAAGKPLDHRMDIMIPKVVAKGSHTAAGIYSNYYLGGEKDTLLYRIDSGEWKEMKKVEDYDPIYTNLVMEWDFGDELMPGRRPSNPGKSRHLWRGNLPTNLDLGRHTVDVMVKDMFGRTFVQSSSYRLEEPK